MNSFHTLLWLVDTPQMANNVKLHPQNLTWPPKNDGWKMSFLLGLPIFRGLVKLWGGMLLITPKTTVAKAGILIMEIVKMLWIQQSSTDAPLLYGIILPIGCMGVVYLLTW